MATLASLRKRIAKCTACPLHEHRTKVVFGEGDRHARVLIVGEAPGANEDKVGRPFIGDAGKLLNKLLRILGPLHLTRGNGIYITNAICCQPPGNRKPKAEELDACRGRLHDIEDIIKPELVVLLGEYALRARFGVRGLGAYRGAWHIDLPGARRAYYVAGHPASALHMPGRRVRGALESDWGAIKGLLELGCASWG